MSGDRTLTNLKEIKDPYLRGTDFRAYETSKTLGELTKEKRELLEEIDKLSKIFFGLKSGIGKLGEQYVGFETDRIKTLEYLGKEVSLALDEEADVLKGRSEDLDKLEGFLEELSDYAQELVRIGDVLSLDNELKSVQLAKEVSDVVLREKKASDLVKKFSEKVKNITKLEDDAKYKEKRADELLTKVEEGFKVKQREWEKKDTQLEIERAEVRGKKEYYETQIKKVKEREKRLGDKERALERKIKELGVV